jgi:hypothetical protein
VHNDSGFPKWAIIPIVAVGGILLLFMFILFTRNSEVGNDNLRVNVSTRPATETRAQTGSQTVDVPSGTYPSTVTVPPSGSQSVTVPGSQTGISTPPSSKGTVIIDAKIAPRTGAPRPVRNEKFYLLDKDLETILSEARIEPIEGQTLTNSLGLSVVFPDRYGDFNRKALRAIKEHIKYAGQTDSSGKAELGNIDPDSYYLFGVTRAGNGFAIWSSPVSIIAGQNMLNLSPQQITEMQDSSGE